MNAALQKFIAETGLEREAAEQVREVVAVKLQDAKKITAKRQKQLASDIRKRAVYRACLNGLNTVKSKQLSFRETLSNSNILSADDMQKLEARWREVDAALKALQRELSLQSDAALLHQWLDAQETEALTAFYDGLLKG
jgi:DNA-binding transcriptional regulator YbjK